MTFRMTEQAAAEALRLLAPEPTGTRLRYDVIGDRRAARVKLYLGPIESAHDLAFEVAGVPMVTHAAIHETPGAVTIDFAGDGFTVTAAD